MNIRKLETIRRLNVRQDLPPQASDDTIFNGALFDVATLGDITVPRFHFAGLLSTYTDEEIATRITEYGRETARQNRDAVYSVGCLPQGTQVCKLFITLLTREVNRSGYWCLVQRTIFMHKENPFVSTDFIALSTVVALEGVKAPDSTFYRRQADLGPPEPVAQHK